MKKSKCRRAVTEGEGVNGITGTKGEFDGAGISFLGNLIGLILLKYYLNNLKHICNYSIHDISKILTIT
jgi:hypothetical protein